MQLEVRQSEGIFVISGECGSCKRGNSSLIFTKVQPLTMNVANIELVCMCCDTKYKTRLRFTGSFKPSEDMNDD